MTLKQLEYFLAIAENGSITKAARNKFQGRRLAMPSAVSSARWVKRTARTPAHIRKITAF